MLIAALVGAFLGALAARLYCRVLPFCFTTDYRLVQGSLFSRLLIPAFFPTLLLLAQLTCGNAALLLAFFGRGAVIAFLLCAGICFLGPETARELTLLLGLRCLLPLPVYFYAGGRILRRPAAQSRIDRILPVFLSYAAAFLALIPELLLRT